MAELKENLRLVSLMKKKIDLFQIHQSIKTVTTLLKNRIPTKEIIVIVMIIIPVIQKMIKKRKRKNHLKTKNYEKIKKKEKIHIHQVTMQLIIIKMNQLY